MHTNWGDTVGIVGETAQFGVWSPPAATLLSTDQSIYPVWRTPAVSVACDRKELEFKLVIISPRRQGGDALQEWQWGEYKPRTLRHTRGHAVRCCPCSTLWVAGLIRRAPQTIA